MYSVTLQYVLDSRKPIFNNKPDKYFYKEELRIRLSEAKLIGYVSIPLDNNDLYRPFYAVGK
ncbi:hypothetical protein D8X92_13720 [Listeria ivanovii]|uniref:Uncharacterized protein n=1 Tax=Listeria ivanovii subsp. londoniensis TaxID=202752 RepID=A0ABS1G7W8_LISIV|nr:MULTISPECIES: hypothetical protein [Listeria]MBK1962946.1 hypothetical protein [Listeria ivanovii subsp. londoniensis]MBM5721748.1 hypothetical protein [Listeria ivanovii]